MDQQMLHRLYTPLGTLLSDPNALTMDAREYISKGVSREDIPIIQSRVQACLLDDERIFVANVQVTFNSTTQKMQVQIQGTGAFGPFSLTLEVSALTVEILRV